MLQNLNIAWNLYKVCNMLIQISFLWKRNTTIITFIGRSSFIDGLNMPIQMPIMRKSCITNVALFLFLKWFNMHHQTWVERKSCITKIILEWFVSFMNWFNMPIKMSFERKIWVTNITFWRSFLSTWTDSSVQISFEGFLPFMNWFNWLYIAQKTIYYIDLT